MDFLNDYPGPRGGQMQRSGRTETSDRNSRRSLCYWLLVTSDLMLYMVFFCHHSLAAICPGLAASISGLRGEGLAALIRQQKKALLRPNLNTNNSKGKEKSKIKIKMRQKPHVNSHSRMCCTMEEYFSSIKSRPTPNFCFDGDDMAEGGG